MKIGKLEFGRSAKSDVAKKTPPNRSRRRRTVLFQDGLAALSVAAFLFFGATAREVNLLLALAALFGGFVALDYFWGRRTLRRLRVSRTTPDAVFAGEPFRVSLEVQNVGKRSSWAVVVEDDWTPETGEENFDAKFFESAKSQGAKSQGAKSQGAKPQGATRTPEAENSETTLRPVAYFPQIRGGETRKERYSGVVSRRGTRRLTSLTVSTRFPCGFFRSWERFDAPAELLVFPQIGVLTDAWNVFAGDTSNDATVATGRSSRIPDETLTVRDWRPGDPKKAIHWRATAKRDRLQARDFEERKARSIFLILDLFAQENDSPNRNGGVSKKKGKNAFPELFRRLENVELAVSFAATLIDRWTRSGDARFYFAVNGDDSASPDDSTFDATRSNNAGAAASNIGGQIGQNGQIAPFGSFGSRGSNDQNAQNDVRLFPTIPAANERDAPLWSDGTGGGALRGFLTRLATATEPRRDRLAEIVEKVDAKALAEAQIFVVSVAPFDFERLNSPAPIDRRNDASPNGEEQDENVRENTQNRENRGDSLAGNGWRNARFIDVSSDAFSDYFLV